MIFETEGINTVIAHNGREGLEMLEQFIPDMIMLDMMMPEMDGLHFLQRLRELGKFDQIPVLVMSALDRPEVKAEVMAAGAVKFLEKPVQIPVLIEEIRKLLTTHA